MKTKKRLERTGQAKKKAQEVSEQTKGGGRLDGKDAIPKTQRKTKGKSTENVRTPN